MRIVLIIVFLLTQFYDAPAQHICSMWSFNSITNKAGDTLISIIPEDYMQINEDGTFYYELAAKNNLVAKGTWTLQDKVLCYNYTLPTDTLRCYNINFTESELILKEGEVNFSFLRNEQEH